MTKHFRFYSIWLLLTFASLCFGQGPLTMIVGKPDSALGVISRVPGEGILVVRSNVMPLSFESNHGKSKIFVEKKTSGELWLYIKPPGTHMITFMADCFQSIQKEINIEERISKRIKVERNLADFHSVKQTDQQPPQIYHTPPGQADIGHTIVWDAEVTDNSCASEVKLCYRYRGETAYKVVRMKKLKNSDHFQTQLVVEAPGIEYYLEALDVFGNGPAYWQSNAQPYSIQGNARFQQKCETALLEAEQNYAAGRFDRTIDLVNECLSLRGLGFKEKKTAYRLLAWCYAAEDSAKAELYVWRLLNLEPDYQPTAKEPASFKRLLESVKQLQKAPQRANSFEVEGPSLQFKTWQNRLFSLIFFDIYYQLSGFSSPFWKLQFGETKLVNYHEGVGGSLGIGNPVFRFGAGSHNMLHRNWESKAPYLSGAGYELHALAGVPYKRLVRIELGLGYYWMDYKLTNRANETVAFRNNGAFVIFTSSLGAPNVKIFGEADLGVKPNGTLPFLYFRTGLRFAYPIKSDLKR